MNRRLEADLARWEADDLSLDDLRRLHPDGNVDAVVALHGRFSALVDEPAPDPATAWAALAPMLVDAPPTRLRQHRRSRRAVVAAVIAAALAVPTVSYAAAPDAVRSVVREVRDLLPGLPDDDVTPAHERPDGPRSSDGDAETDTHDDDGATTTASTPPVPPTSATSPTDQGDTHEVDEPEVDEPEVEAPDAVDDSPDEAPDVDTSTDGADGADGAEDPPESDDAAVESDATGVSATDVADEVDGHRSEDPALAELAPTDD